MPVDFVKMQGIGNDYIYINAIQKDFNDVAPFVQEISDRHFGVGSDGVIFVKQADQNPAHYRMEMYNADGSRAEMCGNGLRCVAKYLFDRGLESEKTFPIQTDAGVLSVEIVALAGDKASDVRINMGEPRLRRSEIPMSEADEEHALNQKLEIAGKSYSFTALSMGNPHCVIFTQDYPSDQLVHSVGPQIENHPAFPKRTNVEFVQVLPSPGQAKATKLIQRTWERGSGETLACGTGASAVCVAGVLEGRSERNIEIELLGGKLKLEWNQEDNCVYKTGPAVEVFTGQWP